MKSYENIKMIYFTLHSMEHDYDTVLAFSSFTFDIILYGIFGGLRHGRLPFFRWERKVRSNISIIQEINDPQDSTYFGYHSPGESGSSPSYLRSANPEVLICRPNDVLWVMVLHCLGD